VQWCSTFVHITRKIPNDITLEYPLKNNTREEKVNYTAIAFIVQEIKKIIVALIYERKVKDKCRHTKKSTSATY